MDRHREMFNALDIRETKGKAKCSYEDCGKRATHVIISEDLIIGLDGDVAMKFCEEHRDEFVNTHKELMRENEGIEYFLKSRN